jgi:hypothetical protein
MSSSWILKEELTPSSAVGTALLQLSGSNKMVNGRLAAYFYHGNSRLNPINSLARELPGGGAERDRSETGLGTWQTF